MIDNLKLSWRKGGDSPTATELNKLVAKINEIVGVANNGIQSSNGGSSFDWTTIPSASLSNRGLMTMEQVAKLDSMNGMTYDELIEILGDYYVKSEYVIDSESDFSDSNTNIITAGYAKKFFFTIEAFNTFYEEYQNTLQNFPTLDGNNTFVGINTFNGDVEFSNGYTIDNVKVEYIQTSTEDASASDDAIPTTGYVDKYYLRKDYNENHWQAFGGYDFVDQQNHVYFDIGAGKVFFEYLETFNANESFNDLYGNGVTIKKDEQGYGYIYTDELHVRKTAWFRSVTIEETKHIGGETILSCAYCIVSIVKHIEFSENGNNFSYYVCFFDKEANGKKAYQMWEKGDQARLQQTTVDGSTLNTRYYWRVVTGCGDGANLGSGEIAELIAKSSSEEVFGDWCEDYYFIILSDNAEEDLGEGFVGHDIFVSDQRTGLQGFEGTSEPEVNDEIVLLGNRNLDSTKNYRRAAQLYSTAMTNSPLRKYYTGIGIVYEAKEIGGNIFCCYKPFSMVGCEIETIEYTQEGTHWEVGKDNNYIRFTEAGGLEASLSSLNIVSGSSITNVVEALGESFHIWTKEIDWYAKDVDPDIPQKIYYAEVFPSEDWTTPEERASHYGDYLVTLDGFAYEFKDDDYWDLTSDYWLIYAQKIAEEAAKSLKDMADDNIITIQEKGRLRQIRQEIKAEHDNLVNEAKDVSKTEYNRAYMMFDRFLGFILNMPTDVDLGSGDNELCVNIGGAILNTTNNDSVYNFSECYENYYTQAALLRRRVTEGIVAQMTDVVGNLEQKVQEDINKLYNGVAGSNKGLLQIDEDLSALMKAAVGEDGNYFSGFVTDGTYSSMVTNLYAKDADGNTIYDEEGNPVYLTSALATTFVYVTDGHAVSGFRIKADRIQFEGNVGIQGLTYRIPSKPSGFSNSDRIYDGLATDNPQKPLDDHVYDYYKVNVWCTDVNNPAGSGTIGMYAFNLARTGSFIDLSQFGDGIVYFLLPCVVDNGEIVNRFVRGNGGEYQNSRHLTIINFFREQAYKYLGNTIVIKLPANMTIQFESSEYGDNAMPLLVGRGISIPEDKGTGNYEYNGSRGMINTESAWVAQKNEERYIVLTSKFMTPLTNHYSPQGDVVTYNVDNTFLVKDTIPEQERHNVLGWEIAIFNSSFTTRT